MNESDYPALYQAVDQAAKDAQHARLATVAGIGIAGILGTGLMVYAKESRVVFAIAAALFLLGLALNGLTVFRNFEAVWYRARAVAESIKTISWRFIMRSEPYDALDVRSATSSFVRRLHTILSAHAELGIDLAAVAGEANQITPEMSRIRDLPLEDRVSFYKQHRIEEQRTWYAKKAASNKGKGKKWFFVLVVTQGGAIVCTLLRVAEPAWDFLPTDVLVVAAASTLGWMQFKRFRELAAAYSLAAQEIGLAREELTHVTDEHEFAHFVTKTENVFSREHMQWAARKF